MSIKQGDSYYRTQDTRLVACLTSVGFSLFHNPPFHKHVDPIRNKQKLTWCINPLSDCGKKKVTDYANAYHDPFFFKSDDYKGMEDFKQAVALSLIHI